MAKWGEGDPRWIVEQRSDGHNVNNWHWRERDATDWSKKEIKRLLNKMVVDDPKVGKCDIKEVTVTGEATVNNRKNKIILLYDLVLKGKWKGSLNGSTIVYEGEFHMPNLSDENDYDELDVEISFTKDQQECRELKEVMRVLGANLMREKMKEFIKNLRDDCASTVQVPTKDSPKPKAAAPSPDSIVNNFKRQEAKASPDHTARATVGTKINTKKLLMTVTFMTEVSELYKALTLSERVSMWTRSKVTANAQTNEEFSFFDGHVTGKFMQLCKDEKMVMRWRQKSWPPAHFSLATITLNQTPDGAELKLEQTGVPESSVEATKQGWHRYYWNPIKATFGYGSNVAGIF